MTDLPNSSRETLIAEICQDEAVLASLLEKKKELTKNLYELDAKIYRLETSYLEETRSTGNVVKGFDQYLVEQSSSSAAQRNHTINPSDRIFTNSSARHFELRSNTEKSSVNHHSRDADHSSATTKTQSSVNRPRNTGRPPRTTSPLVLRFPNPNNEKKHETFSETPATDDPRSRTPPRIRLVVRKPDPSDGFEEDA